MRKFTATLICLAVMSAVGPQASGTVLEQQPMKGQECSQHHWFIDKHHVSLEATRGLVACVARNHGIDVSHFVSVADCESSFYAYAVNGRFKGVMQMGDSEFETYWPKAHKRFGVTTRKPNPGPLNARANAYSAAAYWQEAGSSPWGCA